MWTESSSRKAVSSQKKHPNKKKKFKNPLFNKWAILSIMHFADRWVRSVLDIPPDLYFKSCT